MFIRIIPLLIFGLITFSFADSASQTDWSGGSGIWGPVSDWQDEFFINTNIECYLNPSYLVLPQPEQSIDNDFNGARSVYSTDVNGDGYMDILGAAAQADEITWWKNVDGSGTSWIEHTIDGDFDGAHSVYAADINGDGYMDVMGAAIITDNIAWWENVDGSGTGWIEHTIEGDFDGACSVYSTDVNGDGHMDVLGAASFDNDITWWENMDGSGTGWTEHTINGDFDYASSVYSADINGDGHMDVLGTANFADDITWWENLGGSGTDWTEHTISEDFDGASSVYSADVNGDGYTDVLGTAYFDADITWWESMDGSGLSWTEHTIDGFFGGASAVYSADVNGDGYMDVLGAAANVDDDIVWWENLDGSGTNWTEHTLDGDFRGARSVYSADFNEDGYMDVLGAAFHDDEITVWETIYPSYGSLVSSVLYLGNDTCWGYIDWTCQEPAGTSVSFQVRACDSPDSTGMGVWSDTLHASCSLYGILDENDSYFQYKVMLQTADPSVTPVLDEVTITWDPVGIEGGESFACQLMPVFPNPVSESPTIGFSLPEQALVSLCVFDISGRLTGGIQSDEYPNGNHQVQLEKLSPGIYFIRMSVEDFTATQRFVVIQ